MAADKAQEEAQSRSRRENTRQATKEGPAAVAAHPRAIHQASNSIKAAGPATKARTARG